MLISKTLKVNRKGSLCFITFDCLEDSALAHAFTTRLGGVSVGDNATMNLSFKTGDNPNNVKQNYKIICDAIGIKPEHLVLSQQTHTANVRVVTKDDIGKGIFKPTDFSDVDALVTAEKGVALVTHSADCCLIAFYDKRRKVIAAAHSGWRGTVQLISKATVEVMREKFGCNPKDIYAAIAPSVLSCCYEVDGPVYEAFSGIKELDLTTTFKDKGNGKYMLDLVAANRQILLHLGIPAENIDATDLCTNCNSEYFHSHRATGGRRGVNALIMELKEDGGN